MDNLQLKIKISGDGKSAVTEVQTVEKSLDAVDRAAKKTSQSLSDMAAKLSKAQSFETLKLTAGMNAAGRAAAELKEQTAQAAAKTAEANRIYTEMVSKLSLSAVAYRAQELAIKGLNAEQIKHIQLLEKQAAIKQASSPIVADIGSALIDILAAGTAAALARDILDTNLSMEMLRAQLTGLTGSAEGSARAFKFIQDFAINTSFEIEGLTQSFVALKNMGIEPTQQVMEAMTNQAAKLGGSQETLSAIVLQLGQAYNKGKLQQEDMVVLAERGVPIYELAAKALNKTGEEIDEMSAKGEMGRDAIDAIIVKMGELANGGNAQAMQTLNGSISNLSDAWHQFEDTLLNDKSEGMIKSIVTSITNSISILTRNMSSDIDAQIAHAQARIDTYNKSGVIGKTFADYTGYDISIEQNKLEALKRQKEKQAEITRQADIKMQSQSAVIKTQGWLDELAADDAAYAAKAKKAAEHEAKMQANAAKSATRQAVARAKAEADAIEKRYQYLRDQSRTADQVFIDTVAEYTNAYNTRNISLEQYINLLARADEARDKSVGGDAFTQALNQQIDQYKQLTLSAREYFIEQLKGQGLKPEQINQVVGQYDTNKAFEGDNKSRDEALKSLEEYSKSLDSIQSKTQQLGDVSSAVFDGALGGVNLLTGAFNNMVSALQDNADALDELNRKQRENAEFIPQNDREAEIKRKNGLKFIAEEKRLNQENTRIALSGVRQVASATAQMFAENTNARRAFNVVALAASVAERAADLAGLGVKAASAVLTQGQGDPYTAFARIAAMAAIVGSVLAAAGAGTFQFGGDTTIPGRPDAADSGTVLGDPAAKSESINNTYELLQDIHAKEYRELKGINAGVAALKDGITNSVTKLFQTGGLQLPGNLNLGKFSNAPNIAPRVLNGPFKFSPDPLLNGIMTIATNDPVAKFLIKGLFGSTTRSVTGAGIYVGGNSLAELLNGGQISGQQYTEITTTKKSWFSKKTTISEVMSALNPEFQDALTQMFRGMGQSMLSMATEFGADMTNSVNNYVIPGLKINLYGMTSQQMIETLNNVLSTQLDTMTSVIFGSLIAKYQKLGEGMFETASRLLVEKKVILDAIDLTGKTFTGDAIAMADGLSTLAGGIKEFKALFDDYYSNFYTEAEQLANTTRRLIASLGDMNMTLPDSRQAYRDLVDAQDLNTAAGREQYYQLLSLAAAADTYYAANEKLRDSMKLLTEDTFKTAVDYKRYLSLASLAGISKATDLLPANPNNTFMPNGNPAQLFPGIAPPVATAMTTVAESHQAVADQIRQLRIEQQAHAVAIAQNTEATAKVLSRWDGDGLPAVRVIA